MRDCLYVEGRHDSTEPCGHCLERFASERTFERSVTYIHSNRRELGHLEGLKIGFPFRNYMLDAQGGNPAPLVRARFVCSCRSSVQLKFHGSFFGGT